MVRNIIVTGGSRGLGLGISRKLAEAGYRVAVIARKTTEQLACAMNEADRRNSGSFRFFSFDLSQIEKIPEMVLMLRKELGAIYGLGNNAAVGCDGTLALMANSRIEQLIRMNTLSPIILTK